MREGIVPLDPRFRRLIGIATIERGLITGAVLLLIGVVLGVVALGSWSSAAFGSLAPAATMRLVIPSAACIVLGFEIGYGSFFLSVIQIRATR